MRAPKIRSDFINILSRGLKLPARFDIGRNNNTRRQFHSIIDNALMAWCLFLRGRVNNECCLPRVSKEFSSALQRFRAELSVSRRDTPRPCRKKTLNRRLYRSRLKSNCRSAVYFTMPPNETIKQIGISAEASSEMQPA